MIYEFSNFLLCTDLLIKSWASRRLNWYIIESLEFPKSLTNCLIIKSYTFLERNISKFFIYAIKEGFTPIHITEKRALYAKIAKCSLNA